MGQEWIRHGSRLSEMGQDSIRNGTRLPEMMNGSENGPDYQKWVRNGSEMARLPQMDQQWVQINRNGSEMPKIQVCHEALHYTIYQIY